MRKSFWIILTVLLVVIAAPCVQADTVTFTCTGDNNTGGACVEAAPTAPNVTFQGPTLEITWFTAENPSPFAIKLPTDWHDTDSFFWLASNNQFGISDANHPFDFEATAAINTNLPGFGGLSEFGTLGFAPGTVAAPEPGTATLMLLGIGLALMMRKRIACGLPQVS